MDAFKERVKFDILAQNVGGGHKGRGRVKEGIFSFKWNSMSHLDFQAFFFNDWDELSAFWVILQTKRKMLL